MLDVLCRSSVGSGRLRRQLGSGTGSGRSTAAPALQSQDGDVNPPPADTSSSEKPEKSSASSHVGADIGITIAVLLALGGAAFGVGRYRAGAGTPLVSKKTRGWSWVDRGRGDDLGDSELLVTRDPYVQEAETINMMETVIKKADEQQAEEEEITRGMNKQERLQHGRLARSTADAQAICATDIRIYTQIWARIFGSQADALMNLEQEVTRIQTALPNEEPRQPAEIDGITDTTNSDYLTYLSMAFEDQDNTMFDAVKTVAAQLGLDFRRGPNKKDGRANDKAKLCYDDDYARLKDLRRASIVCRDIATIITVLLALEAAGIDIRRIKNRFDRKYDAFVSAGYRDLQLNIRIPGIDLIWELQIHLEAIEEQKTQMRDQDDGSGMTGHQRYVAFRTIMERIVNKQDSISSRASNRK